MKRRVLFTLFSILFLQAAAFAQNSGCFEAYYNNKVVTEICVGVPIQFKDCSCNNSGVTSAEYYDLDASTNPPNFGPADQNSPSKTYTFNTPGTFVVTQLYTPVCDQLTSTTQRTFVVKATPPPTFTATQCGSDSVTISVTDQNYDSYTLSIGGSLVQFARNDTYASPAGTYDVILEGKHIKANCGNSSKQTLTAGSVPTGAKITKLDVLQTSASGQIQFTVSGLQSGYSYTIEEQNGSIFTTKSSLTFKGNATETLTLSGLNTTQANCFRVRIFDNCGRSQGLISPTICSTVLEASAQNRKNVISWLPYSGNTPGGVNFSYSLSRQQGSNPAQVLPLQTPQQTSFEDTNITCGLNYCYEVSVVEAGLPFSSSNTACATAISTDIPKPVFLLTSFGNDNALNGTLTIPSQTSLKEQHVFKSRGGSGFSPLLKSTTVEFKDRDKNLQPTPICYQVIYTDNCGNTSSTSNTSCPVILKAEYNKLYRTVKLDWTTYQGFKGNQLTYTLELLDENFQPKSSQPANGILTLTETNLSNTDQLLRYRIKVQTEIPGETSYSNTETVAQEVKIFVPNAFSPNGDGLNDVFEVKGRFQSNFSLVILNRWGQIIFETQDPKKGWDGTMNGSEVPVGVYAYRLSAVDERGVHYDKMGTITLIR